MLDRWLVGQTDDVGADLEAIDASFGVLRDVEMPPRKPDDRAEHLDRIWRIGA